HDLLGEMLQGQTGGLSKLGSRYTGEHGLPAHMPSAQFVVYRLGEVDDVRLRAAVGAVQQLGCESDTGREVDDRAVASCHEARHDSPHQARRRDDVQLNHRFQVSGSGSINGAVTPNPALFTSIVTLACDESRSSTRSKSALRVRSAVRTSVLRSASVENGVARLASRTRSRSSRRTLDTKTARCSPLNDLKSDSTDISTREGS